MKPKPLYGTIKTRDESDETTTTDSRFPLFYENVDSESNGLYNIIGDSDKNTWKYNDDTGKDDIRHLPAENTVFINANIALTDGSSKKFNKDDKTPRTIPNLYDALTGIAIKISELYTKIENSLSNADKYLYVTKDKETGSVTIYPGKFDEDDNTTKKDEDAEIIQIKHGSGPASIDITNNDIQFTIKPYEDTEATTYTLGAMIEAIQELNRRTAFIDSTIGFQEAKKHFDVNNDDINGANYEKEDDGLPAAADSHYNGNFNVVERSVLSKKLKKMKIIAYDPETNKMVDITGKNIPFTQEISMLNDNMLLDDPTVISPENASIRMRGCPYLLQ